MAASDRDLTPSWILQETLNVHQHALDSYLTTKGVTTDPAGSGGRNDGDGLTLTVLGCGTMGTAVLGGILDSLSSMPKKAGAQKVASPERLPSRFIAVVRSAASADRLRRDLKQHAMSSKVSICQGDAEKSVAAVKEADVVLLACKPQGVEPLLKAQGIRDALAGKLLISVCGGVTYESLGAILSPRAACSGSAIEASGGEATTYIFRAIPNTAAAIRESTTVIATPSSAVPESYRLLVDWIFSGVGHIVHISEANMDACTALCGSGPAFVSVFLESLAAGAIAMGVPRAEAYTMAAQTMRGTTGLLLEGKETHPAVLRDNVTSPGGCTAAGLAVLEEGGVRGVIGKAVREAAKAAKGS